MASPSFRALGFPLLFTLLGGCATADVDVDEAPESTASELRTVSDRKPGEMRGVKLKHPGGDNDVRSSCLYMSGIENGDYAGVVRAMADSGIYDLFVKYPQPNQVPAKCDRERIEIEITNVLRAMKSHNDKATAATKMHAWVWERTWLYTDAEGVRDQTRAEYVKDMAGVIQRAKQAEVAGVLEGVGIIETNLKGSAQVRDVSVKLAREINDKTGGWLKDHSLLFPGAGMGSWFKNLDEDLPSFYQRMKNEVRFFSFIYKFMPSQESDPKEVNSALAPYYYGPTAVWSTETKKPASQQRAYIEDTLGLADLRKTITWGKEHDYPSLANVVFWGDSGDGLLKMGADSRNVIHQLLVDEMGERGHFFDFPLIGKTQEDDKTRAKHLFFDTGAGSERNDPTWSEWAKWSAPGATY